MSLIATLRFEFIRLKNFSFFWLVLGLYAVCLTVSFKMSSNLVGLTLGGFGGLADTIMKTTTGLLAMASISGFFEIFLSYVVISLLVQEKEYGTLKQHLIEGQSHLDWVLGKALIVIVLSLVAAGLLGANAYIFLDPEVFESDFIAASNILGQVFFRVLGVLSLAAIAGVVVKRTIKGIMFFTIYTLFGEAFVGWSVKSLVGEGIEDLLPFARFSAVVPKPWSSLKLLGAESASSSGTWSSHPLVLIAYLLLLWGLIYLLMRSVDAADSSG